LLTPALLAFDPKRTGQDGLIWIKPGKCAHLAKGILLELQDKGFNIVKLAVRPGLPPDDSE
jgi:hypothetical protein